MKRSEKIENIRKRFRKRPEWLLIRVSRMDDSTTTPISGQLLAHSSDRDLIFKKSVSQKGLVMIDHSQNKLPEGYAIAF